MAGLFDLTGKTAVVVGGTSGIGLAMALGLADAGADVVASSRRQEQVDEAAKQIEARGPRELCAWPPTWADRKRPAGAGAMRRSVHSARWDILINCGGKIKRAPTVDFPEDEGELDHGHERDRDAALVPDLRQEDAGARGTDAS